MGFLARLFGLEDFDEPRADAQFGVEIPPELTEIFTGAGSIARRISRDEALQVPAVLRARNLIAGTLSTLPVHIRDNQKRIAKPTNLLDQIDPNVPNVVTFAETYEDLLFEGISWWKVTAFGWHGYPTEARHVPVEAVTVSAAPVLPSQHQMRGGFPSGGTVYIDGRPVPDNEVIRFDSPNPPLLKHASRAIRTCLQLDKTASLYASEPMPLGYFAPAKDAQVSEDEDEIQKLLDQWEEARRTRAWGYVGRALEAKVLQFNAEQIQLAEQRQHAVLEIARAVGLDPEDLGVSTTSRTYQNSEQRRQDLLDFTLSAYVAAMEQRLSMRDLMPRGYKAKVNFDGFLRSDTKTRMETHKIGIDTGVRTIPEARELEDLPPLSEQVTSEQVEQEADMPDAAFNDETAETTISFDDPEVAASFRVNTEKRTISGLLVPWGKVARSGFSKWRFAKGSLHWADESRIKLNLHHDHKQAIGVAVRLQSTSAGLDGTFKIARGEEGDRALSLAEDIVLDGFSIEVDFEDGDGWQPDPSDESIRLVSSGKLRGVALTSMPAFDDARVAAVAAQSNQGELIMSEDTTEVTAEAPDPSETFSTAMSGLADKIVDSHQKLTEDLAKSLGDSFSAGMKAALEDIGSPQGGPEPVKAARYMVTRDAPVYSMDGRGPSLVRDAWYASREHDDDAKDRLRRFSMQTSEVQKIVADKFSFMAADRAQFTTVDTTTAADVIPPGYRPDLFVPQLGQGRPIVNLLSRGTIANATPFVVPIFGGITTPTTGDHSEGSAPTEGEISLTTKTVTPGAISGKLPLTREIVDSSNPAIDQIALAAMREDYAQQTEAKAYTALNGADGVGGTITTGFVPSGAQAAVTSGQGDELLTGVRLALANYPFARFGAPNGAVISQEATTSFATAVDTTGRPLLPSIGAQNTAGLGNAVMASWFVDGLPFVPSWSMTGNAAGDADVIILNSSDVWAWESPVLSFRFEEKSGPQIIELALFGYFAVHVLRPVGLSGVRHTAS